MIQDSGQKREFESGAVRDFAEGKGRCDLLPLDIISEFLWHDDVLKCISNYVETGDVNSIYDAVHIVVNKSSFRLFPDHFTLVLEVAKHFEEGSKKYGDRNWQKGVPLHCYIDSAVRHYLKVLRGDDDERHDRAFVWNLLCCLWTQKHRPEMIDLPFANEEENNDDL